MIFINIAANAKEELKESGEKNIMPYWRTLKTGGILNHKFSGSVEEQKKMLEKEGFIILNKGKKYFVKNYEEFLMRVN